MILRIQHLYLALAAIASILCFFFPFAVYLSDLAYYKLMLTGFIHISPDPGNVFPFYFTFPLLGFHLLLSVHIILAIISYKSRPKQLKVIRFALLINILYIAVLFFYTNFVIERNVAIPSHYGPGSYFPLIMLILIMMAKRGIEKDDKLIRSMDRLR
ncbi:MAG: DUF4293 domain-containing protein [Bacteroidota bacterium]